MKSENLCVCIGSVCVCDDLEEQRQFIQDDRVTDESSRDVKILKKPVSPRRTKDYYEWMGCVKEIRPITVTEDVEWSSMTQFQRLVWWIATGIQMLTLTILSLRTDRLLQCDNYMKCHWKHYSGTMY